MRVAEAPGAGLRILLVEDDPGIGRFVHRGLTAEGYAVEWQTLPYWIWGCQMRTARTCAVKPVPGAMTFPSAC